MAATTDLPPEVRGDRPCPFGDKTVDPTEVFVGMAAVETVGTIEIHERIRVEIVQMTDGQVRDRMSVTSVSRFCARWEVSQICRGLSSAGRVSILATRCRAMA